MMLARTLALVVLVGCAQNPKVEGSLPESEFVDTIVYPWCDRLEECLTGEFDSNYADKEECRAGEAKQWEDLLEEFEGLGCTYVPEGGATFYENFTEMDCGTFFLATYADDLDTLFSCASR